MFMKTTGEDRRRLRRWELALLLGLAFSALLGTRLSGEQAALSGQLVRLHVVGASDSVEDQMRKLKARDAVLEEAEPLLTGVMDQQEAQTILAENLELLARAGMEAAGTQVRAEVEESAWFPTKQYNDFALPAGRYPSLTLTLGEGEGRNWWCVVFPPLCLGSVSETTDERVPCLSPEQVSLITGEDGGYVVRFKAVEWWNQLTERLTRP